MKGSIASLILCVVTIALAHGFLFKNCNKRSIPALKNTKKFEKILVESMLTFGLIVGVPAGNAFALEQQYKLPPIDRKDPNRCLLKSRLFFVIIHRTWDFLYLTYIR
jgi:hypothetical protein